MQTATHATPARTLERPSPYVTMAYFNDKGRFVEIKLNLANDEDAAKLRKTAIWAAHNGIEIRIRPHS